MKTIKTLSLLLLTFSLSVAYSQSAITNGHIIFELTDVVTDNPQAKQMLNGALLSLQSKDNVYRSNMSMMGDQINIENYYDLNDKDSRIYLNLMGKKVLTSIPDSVQQAKLTELDENSIVTYFKEDTKEINGFTCYKALVESLQKDGSVAETTMYVTKEVAFPAYVLGGLPKKLDAFPMEFTIKAKGMVMSYTFKSYTQEVAADFNEEKQGFNEMSYDDFMNTIGKQMGL